MNFKMTTRFLTLLLVTFFILPATAKVIDQVTAEKAAKNFLYEKLNQKSQVAYKDVVVSTTYTMKDNNVPVYYGINFRDGGFVIITADDIVKPVVGYSPTGFFNPNDPYGNFKDWMTGVTVQVQAYRSRGSVANASNTAQWARLTDVNFAQSAIEKSGKNLEPLVLSHWDQGKYFNTLCPADNAGPEGRALTGCVATAMAQVVNYFRYPSSGTGNHAYNTNLNPAPFGHYGVLSVNYTNATYNYDGMVNDPSEANMDIAKLMYHCGVAVSMNYGPTASGAQTSDCVGALATHFKYSNTSTSFAQRSTTPNTAWHTLLMTELNAKRPVLYSGRNPEYGHCFVADGYQTSSSDTLYHFNWGWSGNNDGFYDINDLNPGNDPNGPFSDSQGMVKGIYPANSFPAMCSGPKVFTTSQGSIEDGSSFTANYADNTDCSWLLAPVDTVKKFMLSFERFSTADTNDVVKVYDGADANAPLLLSHSGNTIPAAITSTSNRMFITFHTDNANTAEGWLAIFKPIYPVLCTGTTMTATSGTVSDGSGDFNYLANSTCSWVIQPPNPDQKSLILQFTSFNTETNKDFIKVYDLVTETQLGATYSGNTLPPTLVSPSGEMYIEFKSNYANNYAGWTAYYTLGFVGVGELNSFREMRIYPNPANDHLNIAFDMDQTGMLSIEMLSLTGQSLIKQNYSNFSGSFNQSLDLSGIARGVYNLKLSSDKGVYNHKVVVQ